MSPLPGLGLFLVHYPEAAESGRYRVHLLTSGYRSILPPGEAGGEVSLISAHAANGEVAFTDNAVLQCSTEWDLVPKALAHEARW